MNNLFLTALKKKLRFQTSRGLLNIEQLFELGQQELHELYLSLDASIQKSKGLLGRQGNSEVEQKLEIVRSVFDSLQEDKDNKTSLAERRKLRERVLDALDEKETEELKGKSKSKLRKMAEELQD